MSKDQVKDGVIVLAFCWSHVRRDFIRVGKGWPELKTWALEWLRRIRLLYRLNDGRLAVQQDATAFGEADGCLRQAVATMTTQMETELARADLATPCRKALESLGAHWADLWPQLFSDVNCIALWISSEKTLTRLYSVLHWFHKRLEVNVKNPRENRCFQTIIVFSFGSVDNSQKCTVLWKIAAKLITVGTSVNNEMWVKLSALGGADAVRGRPADPDGQ